MKVCSGVAAVFAIGLLAAGPGWAEDTWQVTPYAWVAGFEGTVGAPGGGGGGGGDRVDFGSLVDNIELGGGMLNVGWRQARWTVFGDWTYARVTSGSPTGLALTYTDAEAEVQGHIVQAFAGRDLLAGGDQHLDLFAGTRYYNLDTTLSLFGGVVPDIRLNGADTWFDAVAGLRWTRRFGTAWESMLHADAGTGGSDLSWQLAASIGYRFGWGALVGGWRHLAADRQSGAYRLDVALSGPFVGASFRF